MMKRIHQQQLAFLGHVMSWFGKFGGEWQDRRNACWDTATARRHWAE